MTAKNLQPQPGQLSMESLQDTPRNALDLDQMAAFGRVLTPRFFDLSPDLVPAEPSPESLRAVSVPVLRQRIYEGDRQSVGGLLWNSDEYEAIVRSPRAFGHAVVAKTTKARQLDVNPERRQGAIERSEQHAFEGKYEKMSKMLDFYTEEEQWLSRLGLEARTPGYAHMRLGKLLGLATSAWQISFQNILRAVGEHRQWAPERAKEAEEAMTFQLFYAPQKPKDPNMTPKLEYWQGMLDLALEYNHRRARLVRQRVKNAKSHLK